MNYSKADGKYASTQYLDALANNLIIPCISGHTKSLITFRGSGHRSLLLFLIRNWNLLHPKYNNHIFTWVDFQLAKTPSEMFSSSLSYIVQTYPTLIPENLIIIINDAISNGCSLNQYEQILFQLVHIHKYQITIIFNNFSYIYYPEYDSILINYLKHILHIYPQSINTLTLIDIEYTSKNLRRLEEISSLIMIGQVYGKDIQFDWNSFKTMCDNYQVKYSKSLTKKQQLKIFELAGTDPTVLKYLLEKIYLENLDVFDKDIYNKLNADWLNTRYMNIWDSLTKNSQQSIITNSSTQSDFIINSGILHKGSIGDLFKIFLKRIAKDITQKEISIRKYLTAKEVLIYNLLEDNINQVVTKDHLAKIIWGKNWSDDFSDYALTKTISRLRLKLIKFSIKRNIKVVRGEGVLLSQISNFKESPLLPL